MSKGSFSVFIFGAGKVGRALANALRKASVKPKWRVTLRAARQSLPKNSIDADVVVLALRDRDLAKTAAEIRVAKRAVVVHVAGALDAEVLAPIRASCAGVAQMHPMISFASTTFFPTLARGNMRVSGDTAAVTRAKKIARAIGMTPREFPKLDVVGYHAAAALTANGAVALAAQAALLLAASNVPRADAPKLLGPLLRSVAENVERLGFPDALTGPVRRGDPSAIERGGATLASRAPDVLPLYRASVLAQVPIARALGEVSQTSLDAIEAWAKK